MVSWTSDAEPGRPYWWDGLTLNTPDDRLPDQVDLLVIGAGYTGLSAAIAASECGASVAVVDAGVPGHGASTRNGGMFGAHPRLQWDKLAMQFGPDVADGVFTEAQPALDWVKELITREDIDCDLQNTGRIQLAWTKSHFDGQHRLAETIRDKSPASVEIIPRDRLGTEIITDRYFGGLLFPDHCAIQPARFHQGLLRAVARRDIPITGNAPVTELARDGSGFTARTPKGTLRAGKVVLATNGYTTQPFRWLSARVFALPSYLIATEPLPHDLIDRLAPGRRMMVETRARHSYFRVSPDGTRILFGGRASMRNIPLVRAAQVLHATMCEIWPDLRDTRVSHAWTGNTGFSFNQTPHVGHHNGLHYAMGYSGSGTVMAPYLGAKAGYQAMDDPRGNTVYSQTRLKRHWAHPTEQPHFLKAANLWYRTWVDRRENARSR